MREKINERSIEFILEKFRENNFSHNSAEEFLRLRGENISNFRSVHLSTSYVNAESEDERIYKTEIKLAGKAIERGCMYVTNIDYCVPCIAATGLKPV